ncbi:hypothetical protein VC83_03028 [Pseudogymnoascus destructans]|uniref:Uncharacterized protein n=1 Tax=Pseudogymnoascus destructans TaxID=655981 RepID=A0A177ACR2_9PEZI|nr:uncharacterized protein VC83_03028 [Pseudogymnoascus destructans]OAF59899.1 hypothetical protein VC83_03028 [Pseudogymnoascus destructans]
MKPILTFSRSFHPLNGPTTKARGTTNAALRFHKPPILLATILHADGCVRHFHAVAVKYRGYGGSWLEGSLKGSVAGDFSANGATGAKGSVRAVWGGSIWTEGALADDITIQGSVDVQYGCIQRGHAGDLDPWLTHAA